jgi:hypothetical protein
MVASHVAIRLVDEGGQSAIASIHHAWVCVDFLFSSLGEARAQLDVRAQEQMAWK